jgi:hypothetical protein
MAACTAWFGGYSPDDVRRGLATVLVQRIPAMFGWIVGAIAFFGSLYLATLPGLIQTA